MDGQVASWLLLAVSGVLNASALAWVAWRHLPADESPEGPDPGLMAVAAELKALRVPVRPSPQVTLRLMSGSGTREVGRMRMDARWRTPTVRQFLGGRWQVFAASHVEDGVWIYRRVGIEA